MASASGAGSFMSENVSMGAAGISDRRRACVSGRERHFGAATSSGRHNIAGVRFPLGAVARVALAAAVVGVARTPSASAAPLTAELVVERAPGADDCPDGDGLARLIERIVGPGAGGLVRPGGEVRASVRFSRDASIYRATLLLAGAKQGERTLTDTGPT